MKARCKQIFYGVKYEYENDSAIFRFFQMRRLVSWAAAQVATTDSRRRKLMPNSQRPGGIEKGSPLSILFILCLSATCLAQSLKVENREKLENYKGKNGILSMKTLVLGGDFRVTTIIPFKGNLAEYHHLEITRPVSLVGGALTSEVSNQQLAKLKSQFEARRIFESVTVIDSYSAAVASQPQKQSHKNSYGIDGAEEDSLDSPIGSFPDMQARDKQRSLVEQKKEPPSDRTLVTVIETLDYAKGNRIKQLLPLDLGKSILTVRLRYYDKASGQEIGRQIISGRASGSSLLGPLSPRDALSGVADGFVDQVTRRVAASVK
jgi:hypothetical protein